jgi:hypothetical protein
MNEIRNDLYSFGCKLCIHNRKAKYHFFKNSITFNHHVSEILDFVFSTSFMIRSIFNSTKIIKPITFCTIYNHVEFELELIYEHFQHLFFFINLTCLKQFIFLILFFSSYEDLHTNFVSLIR